jgi:hypothetical protein
MNATQELITISYTLSHSVSTIKSLRDSTLSQIELFKKENFTDSLTFTKLNELLPKLNKLLEEAILTNDFLNNIDESKK